MSNFVVRAVRGAITVEEDTKGEILAATAELLTEVMSRNGLVPDDLISILFTATPDLTADFPAVAARTMGLAQVPLMCAQEIPVAGAMARCIRVMAHCYAPQPRVIRHVYLRNARQLRLDLPE